VGFRRHGRNDELKLVFQNEARVETIVNDFGRWKNQLRFAQADLGFLCAAVGVHAAPTDGPDRYNLVVGVKGSRRSGSRSTQDFTFPSTRLAVLRLNTSSADQTVVLTPASKSTCRSRMNRARAAAGGATIEWRRAS